MYDTNGNPTRTITEPLVDGGQFAPQSSGNSVGNVYINARWQFNANGMYQAPFGIDVAANVFGRQGYPFPLFRTQALGADTGLSVLVTPTIDTFRYDNVWDTDLRVARTFKLRAVSLRLIGDVFNVTNANTVLIRNNNVLSTAFNTIAQNVSPRIFRAGTRRSASRILNSEFLILNSQRAPWLRSQARASLYPGHASATSFQNFGEWSMRFRCMSSWIST